MARLVTRPTTADLVEQVTKSDNLDYQLDELFIAPECRLVDRTVAETEASRKHRLLVVAIKGANGKMLFNPDGTSRFEVGDTVILRGRSEDIENFRHKYHL